MILFYYTPFSNLPDPNLSFSDGLSFISQNMNFELLVHAYSKGFFPWYIENDYVHWFSPPIRPILKPEKFYISHSFKKKINKKPEIRINENFNKVMDLCEKTREDSWINLRYKIAYNRAFQKGHAFSVEYIENNDLKGGLYGIKTGSVFTGESMFNIVPDGAKIALWGLIQHSKQLGIEYIDGQVPGSFLDKMGFDNIDREEFYQILKKT